MIDLSYDFHIHTCLSPCGDNDMTPQNIAAMAALKKLDAIAITDHNTCKNCAAIMEAAEKYNLLVIPGMELTTSEEVHVLCLFYDLSSALDFDEYVYQHLLSIKNNEKIFGQQLLCNSEDEVTGTIDKLLISSTDISLEILWETVTKHNGIILPAHIDKDTTSIISNLGFIPPDSKFNCIELRELTNLEELVRANPIFSSCIVTCSSDAHYLQDIHEPIYTLPVPEKNIQSILDTLCKK
jgi:hypothetical protein